METKKEEDALASFPLPNQNLNYEKNSNYMIEFSPTMSIFRRKGNTFSLHTQHPRTIFFLLI